MRFGASGFGIRRPAFGAFVFKVWGAALGFGVFKILGFCGLRRRARRFRSIAAGGARVVRVFCRLVRRARARVDVRVFYRVARVFYRLARRASAFACSTALPVTRAPPRQSRARRRLRVLPRCKPAVAYSAASPGARASTFACSTASRAYSSASPGARLFFRVARVFYQLARRARRHREPQSPTLKTRSLKP